MSHVTHSHVQKSHQDTRSVHIFDALDVQVFCATIWGWARHCRPSAYSRQTTTIGGQNSLSLAIRRSPHFRPSWSVQNFSADCREQVSCASRATAACLPASTESTARPFAPCCPEKLPTVTLPLHIAVSLKGHCTSVVACTLFFFEKLRTVALPLCILVSLKGHSTLVVACILFFFEKLRTVTLPICILVSLKGLSKSVFACAVFSPQMLLPFIPPLSIILDLQNISDSFACDLFLFWIYTSSPSSRRRCRTVLQRWSAAARGRTRSACAPLIATFLQVCPPTLIGHWAHEINNFCAGRMACLQYMGTPTARAALRK